MTQDQLSGSDLDVLVIGGGIVGAGLARDAALRGMRTALVEQYDFASGASSRTSRLLHGGLRYLAQGRIGLVRQASREKLVLQRIAPHLAQPLAFLFPTYKRTPWPRWQLAPGVKLYDLLCGLTGNLGRSMTLNRREMLAALPGLRSQNLTGGVRYYDGFTQDARLVLDTLRSAARHGAVVRNYTRFVQARREGAGWRCLLGETESGRSISVSARCVVSAAGPWAMQLPHNRLRLRLTKGVHLLVERARLPVPEAVVLSEGKRILFAIPWGARVILGTTDTDYTGRPEDARTEPQDVRCVLDVVNGYFPEARLAERDVLGAWAGLRPLLAGRGGCPSDISRSHRMRMNEPGWLELAGGKLTTYRLMAEQAVDRVARYLRVRAAPCRTALEPLLEAGDQAAFSGILPPPVTRSAVEHYCRNEWARGPEDVMVRRASWQYYLNDAPAVAAQVAAWMEEIAHPTC